MTTRKTQNQQAYESLSDKEKGMVQGHFTQRALDGTTLKATEIRRMGDLQLLELAEKAELLDWALDNLLIDGYIHDYGSLLYLRETISSGTETFRKAMETGK